MQNRWMALLILITSSAIAQEPTADSEQALAERAIELAKVEANALEAFLGDRRLELEPKPLLRWSNPLSGQIYGDVYIWTLDGRPEVIASIYKWFSPYTHLATELQSLSESPLRMTRYGNPAWSPSRGIEMKPLPNAPAPSDREFQRTRQMRVLSEQFHAEAEDRSDSSKRWILRSLAKPIYRYRSEERGIIDGTMFAFCQGNTNNPEVLLMLEARVEEGESRWYYGLGRQNSLRFTVRRNDELIWDVPKLAPPWSALSIPSKPYMVIKTTMAE